MSTNKYKKQKKAASKVTPNVHYLRVQSLSKQSQSIGFHMPVYQYPVLRLWGKWLETAGFVPGSCVSVTVSHEQMVIRKMEN